MLSCGKRVGNLEAESPSAQVNWAVDDTTILLERFLELVPCKECDNTLKRLSKENPKYFSAATGAL